MAFSSVITEKFIAGDHRVHYGTFTNTAGSTGGNIDTGLKNAHHVVLTHTGTGVVASAPVVNETLPIDGSAITIVTTADADGIWIAWGL